MNIIMCGCVKVALIVLNLAEVPLALDTWVVLPDLRFSLLHDYLMCILDHRSMCNDSMLALAERRDASLQGMFEVV